MLLIPVLLNMCVWNRFGTYRKVLCEVKKFFLTDKMFSQDLNLYKPQPGKTEQGYRPFPDKDVLYFVFSVIKPQRYIWGLSKYFNIFCLL